MEVPFPPLEVSVTQTFLIMSVLCEPRLVVPEIFPFNWGFPFRIIAAILTCKPLTHSKQVESKQRHVTRCRFAVGGGAL